MIWSTNARKIPKSSSVRSYNHRRIGNSLRDDIAKVRFPKDAELGAISSRTNEFLFVPRKGDTWEIFLASKSPSILTQELRGAVQIISDGKPTRTIQFNQGDLQDANWLSQHGLSSRIVTWKSSDKNLFRPGVPHDPYQHSPAFLRCGWSAPFTEWDGPFRTCYRFGVLTFLGALFIGMGGLFISKIKL